MTLLKYLYEINNIKSLEDVEVFLKDNIVDIQYIYYSSTYLDLQKDSLLIEDIFWELFNKNIFEIGKINTFAFIELLADYFERFKFLAPLVSINNFIDSKSPLKKRINAALLFLKVNDATKDYIDRFDEIIDNLVNAQEEGDITYKSTISFVNFYYSAIFSFLRIGRKDLIDEFVKRVKIIKENYVFLKENIIEELLIIKRDNFDDDFKTFYNNLSLFISSKIIKDISKKVLSPEKSSYVDELSKLRSKDFMSIRNLSVNYYKSLNQFRKNELKTRLDSGVKIIDDTDLLYSYFVAFGKMHYNKVFESLATIYKEFENQKLEIYDWGCGQALASMIFLEILRAKRINTDIRKIILFEPSELALKRGMSHLICINPNIKERILPICKDLDNIKISDLSDTRFIKLHLFSNILDVPFFELTQLCKKISSLKGLNYFMCISPLFFDINRDIRLAKFYEYFKNNFETKIYRENKNTKKKRKWKSNNCPTSGNCGNHNDDNYLCRDAWTRHEITFSSIIK